MKGYGKGRAAAIWLALAAAAVAGCTPRDSATPPTDAQNAELSLVDGSDGDDWPAYGRTYGEQHYSPLDQIDANNVGKLGLAWYMDLPPGNPVTQPLAVDGTLYFASGLAIVRAVDAATGKLKWTYDPEAGEAAGAKLRQGWGTRGIGYWRGKVYVGTPDGRLIAINARTGTPVWSAMTVGKEDGRYITGAPRIFDGKVIIGHGGADSSNVRGYVTTYDADTGRQLWRFFTVPGNPADGFEDETQEMAAKTWRGEWWKYGGGGTAWNAFAYDPETQTVFVGTGNGAPWNQKIRSPGGGDNLFLCSIVALDAKTGKYKWHYQINPGETWDYNAAMDMQLADLVIDGKPRKVVMQAPKNGFFYVIDRTNGELISTSRFAKVTWASKIDEKTGRPVEIPGARFQDGKSFEMWPSPTGAHSWMPSSFSPKTGLFYVPVIERGVIYDDKGIRPAGWQRTPGNAYDFGLNLKLDITDRLHETSWLKAIDPVTQQIRWSIPTGEMFNGGTMATGGNLLFQGRTDGRFNAYAADSGKTLWSFDAQVPVFAPPATYRVGDVQYVTVIVGTGVTAMQSSALLPVVPDYRSQPRRVLTFRLDGKAALPPLKMAQPPVPEDADYRADAALVDKGNILFATRCAVCHGFGAVSGGGAPELRRSPASFDAAAFAGIVHDGALVANGMPTFGELSDGDLTAIRHYLRGEAAKLRTGRDNNREKSK
ncbi:MAG: PQQ-dependent dehydrogenase, methanol/ethanol family [Sphingobium sp.]